LQACLHSAKKHQLLITHSSKHIPLSAASICHLATARNAAKNCHGIALYQILLKKLKTIDETLF
jgi:hypothetical protein